MARSNPTWGEERIAAELLLKLGIRLSPKSVSGTLAEKLKITTHKKTPQSTYTIVVTGTSRSISSSTSAAAEVIEKRVPAELSGKGWVISSSFVFRPLSGL